MPEQAFGKPAQTFGGDDDEDLPPEEPVKKLDLHRYGLSPDKNIREVFWEIMGSYASTKKPGTDLAAYENERFALIRVAAATLDNQENMHYGLTDGFVSRYTLLMLMDAGWEDAFSEFIEECKEGHGQEDAYILNSLRRIWKEENYQKIIIKYFTNMLRSRRYAAIALHYLARLKNKAISLALKRELVILARGDVGENQINAIRATSLILDEENVRKSFQVLLSHWDTEVRRLIAELLQPYSKDETVKASARRRLPIETNEETKKLLSNLSK